MFSSPHSRPEKGISYLCFTYIALKKDMHPDFSLDNMMDFFMNKKARDKIIEKQPAHPYQFMRNNCRVFSDDTLKLENFSSTNVLNKYWNQGIAIPESITRFVVKLDIKEDAAFKLCANKKFSELAKHITGHRADTISKNARSWVNGDIIELNAVENSSPRHASH